MKVNERVRPYHVSVYVNQSQLLLPEDYDIADREEPPRNGVGNFYNSSLNGQICPERDLLAAILQRAIEDLQLRGLYRNTAFEWIRSTSKRQFGFQWICTILDYDIDKTRKNLIGI